MKAPKKREDISMRTLKLGTVILILAGALAALAVTFHVKVVPLAKASPGCSVKTLHGTYGGTFTLFDLPGPPTGTPQAVSTLLAVNVLEVSHWDGAGNFQSTITGSLAGQAAQTGTDTGTYTVNPNCTGSLAITSCIPGLGCVPLTFDFLIFHAGKEIRFIETDGSGVGVGPVTENLMQDE
jgi:hypothetical protein